MSSYTSNSKQKAFLGWVVIILALAWATLMWMPWGGIAMSQRSYIEFAEQLGADTDYLIVGDSKAGPFSTDCLIPWLGSKRGAVFTADSVTPVFHWYTLREIRRRFPAFRPKVVFIFIGANNMNANGLHAARDFTFFNKLPLGDAWELSGARDAKLLFAEVVLSRIFPAYGHRVQITHLQFGNRGGRTCPPIVETSFANRESYDFPRETRDPIADRNYYDIYRRSAYVDYESSVAQTVGLEKLIQLVEGFEGTPILVLPPVSSEMWSLEQELVGQGFDDTIDSIVGRTSVEVLDLRDVTDFEFRDVNHLSSRGAYGVARKFFEPILENRP